MKCINDTETEIADEELERKIDEYEEYERNMIKDGKWPEVERAIAVNPKVESPRDDVLPF